LFSTENKLIIKIGIYNNPPKIYINKKGNITGYHIDIIKEIAKMKIGKLILLKGHGKRDF